MTKKLGAIAALVLFCVGSNAFAQGSSKTFHVYNEGVIADAYVTVNYANGEPIHETIKATTRNLNVHSYLADDYRLDLINRFGDGAFMAITAVEGSMRSIVANIEIYRVFVKYRYQKEADFLLWHTIDPDVHALLDRYGHVINTDSLSSLIHSAL